MKTLSTRNISVTAIGILLALSGSGMALQAGPQAYRSIPDLVAASDTIMVGDVATIEGAEDGGSGSIVVFPTEFLMGELPDGPVRLTYRRMLNGLGESLVGKRALVFAKQHPESDGLELVPMIDGSGTYLENQILTYDRGLTIRLVSKTSQDSPVQKIIKEMATIQAHSKSSDAMIFLLSFAWSGKEQETFEEVFRAMKHSASPIGFAYGTQGLAALGGLEGLESLDAARDQGWPDLDSALPFLSRYYKSVEPRGVEILARWLAPSSPSKMRAAAAGALARIHTPEAVLILGAALHDADFQVRWRAIGGLSMFANNVPVGGAGPGQGPWPFRTDDTARFSAFDDDYVRENEASHLGFWRAWWADNESAVKKLLTDPIH